METATMAMLDVSIHRSRFNPSEVARVDIHTPDIKRAVIVHYLGSQNCIVIDLAEENDPVQERLVRIDMTDWVEVTVGGRNGDS